MKYTISGLIVALLGVSQVQGAYKYGFFGQWTQRGEVLLYFVIAIVVSYYLGKQKAEPTKDYTNDIEKLKNYCNSMYRTIKKLEEENRQLKEYIMRTNNKKRNY